MSEIRKNKNLYEFHIDGKTKPYVLDVNKGVIIGLRGNPIQNIPQAVVSLCGREIHNDPNPVLRLVYNTYNPRTHSDLYSLADKLNAINYGCSVWDLEQIHTAMVQYEIAFKEIAKFLSEPDHGSIHDYFREVTFTKWQTKHHITPNDHLTESMIEYIYNEHRNRSDKEIALVAYFLSRGVWEFFDGYHYEMTQRINRLFNHSAALNVELDKSDFFRQFINIERMYEQNKQTALDNGIANYQNEKMSALAFEDDNFVVVVPMTNAELVREGERQHNCVGGYGERISERRTNVVFIRRKTDVETNYITCNLYSDGRISQYLTKYNGSVHDNAANAFRQAYQQHILENWGK
jgi:hypothetical protein